MDFNVKSASITAENNTRVHSPLKNTNARPDENLLMPHGSNEQRKTVLPTIRQRCMDCAGSSREVAFCTTWDCALHSFRFGVRPSTIGKRLASKHSPNNKKAGGERHWQPDIRLIRSKPKASPLKSIRTHCLSCSGSSPGVADCGSGNCPLHNLRFGKDPSRKKRHLTDEQMRQFRKRMGHSVEASANG